MKIAQFNTVVAAKFVALAAAVASLGVAGCAAPTTSEEPADVESVSTNRQAITVPNPNAPYFAEVTANGTGCPDGSWDVSIDPTGETFTLRFSAYEATIDPGTLMSIKDCQLGIRLHSPQGLSFSVGELFYSGYAFLDKPGMSARQTAKYYFQGNPIDSSDGRSEMKGATDKEYTFHDVVGLPDLVWSRCGEDRMLNVATRLFVKNNFAKTGTGYLNTSAVDGSLSLMFRLYWKTC